MKVIFDISIHFHQDIEHMYRSDEELIEDIATLIAHKTKLDEITKGIEFVKSNNAESIHKLFIKGGSDFYFRDKKRCKLAITLILERAKELVQKR